jgi:hypothetical protein
MKHMAIAAVLAAAIFSLTGSAQAKAPPSGFELCGPGACTTINAFSDAEPLAIDLFYGGGNSTELWSARVPPAPFFSVRWSFAPGGTHVGYYVPLLNVFRYVGDPGTATETATGLVHWIKLGPGARTIFERLTSTLQPYPAPVLSRVTVGGKPVQDPASYMRLWSVGKPAYTWPVTGFMKIKTTSDLASPWTDTGATLEIARRGPYLTRDSTVYRIPARLARLVRARTSLR